MSPGPRTFSAAVDELIATRSGHHVDDYIEPLLLIDEGSLPALERAVLRVTHRYAADGEPGRAWKYDAVDAEGRVHEVWRMDDPRPADADQIATFRQREAARTARPVR